MFIIINILVMVKSTSENGLVFSLCRLAVVKLFIHPCTVCVYMCVSASSSLLFMLWKWLLIMSIINLHGFPLSVHLCPQSLHEYERFKCCNVKLCSHLSPLFHQLSQAYKVKQKSVSLAKVLYCKCSVIASQ